MHLEIHQINEQVLYLERACKMKLLCQIWNSQRSWGAAVEKIASFYWRAHVSSLVRAFPTQDQYYSSTCYAGYFKRNVSKSASDDTFKSCKIYRCLYSWVATLTCTNVCKFDVFRQEISCSIFNVLLAFATVKYYMTQTLSIYLIYPFANK